VRIVCLPGDGSGPEVTAAAARVLAARQKAPLARDAFASLLPGVPPRRLTDRGSFYRVTAAGEVGTVRRVIEATVRAPAGLDAELVTWRPIGEIELDEQPAGDSRLSRTQPTPAAKPPKTIKRDA
jgi:hypothetical protein